MRCYPPAKGFLRRRRDYLAADQIELRNRSSNPAERGIHKAKHARIGLRPCSSEGPLFRVCFRRPSCTSLCNMQKDDLLLCRNYGGRVSRKKRSESCASVARSSGSHLKNLNREDVSTRTWGLAWRLVLGSHRTRSAERGSQSFTPTLTGLRKRSHLLTSDITLETGIKDILGVLQAEELEETVLVDHSAGASTVLGVADEEAKRIE